MRRLGEQLTSPRTHHGEVGCTRTPSGCEVFGLEYLEARDEDRAGAIRRPRSSSARGEPASFKPGLTQSESVE